MTLPNYLVIIFDQTHTGLKMDDRVLSSYISNRIVRRMRFELFSLMDVPTCVPPTRVRQKKR